MVKHPGARVRSAEETDTTVNPQGKLGMGYPPALLTDGLIEVIRPRQGPDSGPLNGPSSCATPRVRA